MNLLNNINILLSATVGDNKVNYKKLDTYELKQLFNTDYSNSLAAFNLGYRIYRGDINYPIDGVSIATPGIRESENTINIYTTLMSEILSSWKNYPKRNRSFICSTNEDKAAGYTSNVFDVNLYRLLAIFPKNGTSIGVCSQDDIWMSFQLIRSEYLSMNTFNKMIKYIISIFYDSDNTPIMFTHDNKDEILRGLMRVNHDILDIKYNYPDIYEHKIETIKESIYDDPNFILDHINNNVSLLDVIDELLDPDINEFELVNIDNFNITGEHEIWFSNECIMIPMYFINNGILDKVK